MPHVEQQSHGCTTLASKHANHLTTSKVRAPLLRVHTTLYDARTNDRETQGDRKSRTRSPLNFKHVQKSDATAGERKIACNGSDSSCNVGEPSCECQKAGSQSVLKWSCANCERGLRNARSLVTSRELQSGLQIWGKSPLNTLFSVDADTDSASEESVKVIQGRVAHGTLYVRLTCPTTDNRHNKLGQAPEF